MFTNAYRRKLRIWETGYGRTAGWLIERNGQTVAVLTEPKWLDMFWFNYRMEIVTDDPVLRVRMLTSDFWQHSYKEGLVWRSREFDEIASFAFNGGYEDGSDLLSMRALYLDCRNPYIWDRVVLWLRRRVIRKREGRIGDAKRHRYF